MARCGCGSSGGGGDCSCVVQGASGITVTGDGSSSNPYVVAGDCGIEVYDVKCAPYNAAGDGTADDIDNINLALADIAAAGGGVLYFPPGVYRIKSRIDSATDNLHVMGAGMGLAQIKLDGPTAASIEAIFLYGDDVSITDLSVFSVGYLTNTGLTGHVGFIGCNRFELARVEVYNIEMGPGINAVGCTDGSYHDSYIHDTRSDGFHFQTGCKRCSMYNNVAERTGDDGFACSSDDALCEDISIHDNRAFQVGANGVGVYGGKNIEVADNIIDDTVIAGIAIVGSHSGGLYDALDNLTVVDNIIRKVGVGTYNPLAFTDIGSGIKIKMTSGEAQAVADHIRILGNSVSECAATAFAFLSGETANSVSPFGIKNVEVAHNDFIGPGASAVHGGVDFDQVENLSFIGNRLIKSTIVGLFIADGRGDGTVGRIQVIGNSFEDCNVSNGAGRGGVDLRAGSPIIVTGNVFLDPHTPPHLAFAHQQVAAANAATAITGDNQWKTPAGTTVPEVSLGNVPVAAGATPGGGAAVPATVRGFLTVLVNGVQKKIPYFDN